MGSHLRIAALALGTAAAVATLSATAADASGTTSTPSTATSASLASIQAHAAAAITLRVDDLTQAADRAASDSALGSDGPALATTLRTDIAPLQALGQTIAADTTPTVARADGATIYTSYRVLALVLPAGRLASSADRITVTAVPRLTSVAGTVAGRITPANQAAAQPLLNDLNAQIAAASAQTSGLAAAVLAFSPAQWNTNHALLSPARAALNAADAGLTKADSDVRSLRSILRAPTASTATTTPAG
jgi:hypothetical protein